MKHGENSLKVDHLKFTEEVKDAWVSALESGEYIQGFGDLVTKDQEDNIRYCCIGVLGVIHNKLDTGYITDNENPYNLLNKNNIYVNGIWNINDCHTTTSKETGSKNPYRVEAMKDFYKANYSNVIEHIKSLPTVD